MNSSDSAEELVKLSLDGMEVAFKIAGVGAKHIAIMIYTIMKDKQQTKGKTRLTNMLKSGKNSKIFTIRAEDLKKFSQEAKRYGILYCALARKRNAKIDGMVDIMVREEDAAKMNRIAQRFNFRDVASIEREYAKEKLEKDVQKLVSKTPEEQFIDDIMPVSKNEKEKEKENKIPSNDTNEAEEKSQSDTDLNTKKKDKKENSKNTDKKSVKKELKEIEKESKEKTNNRNDIGLEENKENKNKQKKAKHLQKKKINKKGKRYKEPKHLGNKTVYGKRSSKKKERSK